MAVPRPVSCRRDKAALESTRAFFANQHHAKEGQAILQGFYGDLSAQISDQLLDVAQWNV